MLRNEAIRVLDIVAAVDTHSEMERAVTETKEKIAAGRYRALEVQLSTGHRLEKHAIMQGFPTRRLSVDCSGLAD